MTLVKICGITNRADAEAAIEAGADAVGFIAVPESPRYVSPDAFAGLTEGLPVARVLVVKRIEDASAYLLSGAMVAAPGNHVVKPYELPSVATVRPSGYDFIQFYEGPDRPTEIHAGVLIRVFRVRDRSSLDEIAAYQTPVSGFHLDTHHPSMLGGVGLAFDWSIAGEAVAILDKPVILAGGLTPDNVAEAVAEVRPYAVDVASGVEERPGVKDHGKVRAFIEAVRDADRR